MLLNHKEIEYFVTKGDLGNIKIHNILFFPGVMTLFNRKIQCEEVYTRGKYILYIHNETQNHPLVFGNSFQPLFL